MKHRTPTKTFLTSISKKDAFNICYDNVRRFLSLDAIFAKFFRNSNVTKNIFKFENFSI